MDFTSNDEAIKAKGQEGPLFTSDNEHCDAM